MQTIKKNLDTLSILNHMLDCAKERVKDPDIDPNYKRILEERIPDLEHKIMIFSQSLN